MEITSIDDFDVACGYASFWQTEEVEPRFRPAIYMEINEVRPFTRTAVLKTELGESDWKVVKIRSKDKDRDRDKGRDRSSKPKGNVEAGIVGSWGKGKGLELEGYIEGKVRKDDGYIKGEITCNTDGEGEINAVAGYDIRPKVREDE